MAKSRLQKPERGQKRRQGSDTRQKIQKHRDPEQRAKLYLEKQSLSPKPVNAPEHEHLSRKQSINTANWLRQLSENQEAMVTIWISILMWEIL